MPASSSGNQPPSNSLIEFAAKKMDVDDQEEAVDRDHEEGRKTPLDRDQRREQGGDRHQKRHGDAIGAGKCVRAAENQDRPRPGGKQPVHQRYVNLSDRMAGGVLDVHPRQESELDRLLGQREHTRYDRLRGDHGRKRGERNKGIVQPVGGELIERVIERGRIGNEQGPLSEVVQHQCGQGHCKPRQADWKTPEMSHVGVHRFAAGDGEKRRTKYREADVEILVDQEFEGIERAERGQHRGRLGDAVDAEQRRAR